MQAATQGGRSWLPKGKLARINIEGKLRSEMFLFCIWTHYATLPLLLPLMERLESESSDTSMLIENRVKLLTTQRLYK